MIYLQFKCRILYHLTTIILFVVRVQVKLWSTLQRFLKMNSTFICLLYSILWVRHSISRRLIAYSIITIPGVNWTIKTINNWIFQLTSYACDKVCQWLMGGRWFSPGTPVSFTNKNDGHNITELLLKVALSTITLNPTIYWYFLPLDGFEFSNTTLFMVPCI